MEGRLQRLFQEGLDGTIGAFDVDDLRLWCLEPPWTGGGKGSRIPPGVYDLERHPTHSHGDCWWLVGNGVALEWSPGVERTAILIHVGNVAADTEGCLLIGRSVGYLRGHLAVLESRSAIWALEDALEHDPPHQLEIIDVLGGWEVGR